MPKKQNFKWHPRRFYEMRVKLGLTQKQAAEVLGLSSAIIVSKLENGHNRIQRHHVIIYDLLGRLREPQDYRPPSGK